jgi:polysaccharide export outer membrane protein
MTTFMLNKQHLIFSFFLGMIFCISSCTSTRKMIYLQGTDNMFQYPQKIQQGFELYIQPDDRLFITISTKDKELLEPFSNNELLGSVGRYSSQQTSGLKVDKNGNIQTPILGEIHAGGLTCSELENEIKKRLIIGEYIKSPIVTVQIKNFTVSVLGEVRSPGVKEISRDKITVLEAISAAGDLLPSARRDNVLVIREVNGERVSYSIDLTSAENVFSSPGYYLRQSDVVYIEPNSSIRVKGSAALSFLGAAGTVISVLASVVSLTLTLLVLNKN